MVIFPAIDLKEGRCVRLRQGEMSQETRYSDDPAAMAKHWQDQGGRFLHVVDLDGAVNGTPKNIEKIEQIRRSISIPIQVGGGIRSLDTIRRYLSMGIDRVVLGTAALEQHELMTESCEAFPDRVLVGLDVKHGEIALRGWKDGSGKKPEDVLPSLRGLAIAGIVFTDIARDGMLEGPNLEALRDMAAMSPVPVVASGGVTRVADIHAIAGLGPAIMGIIVGKALYEGAITLPEAIRAAAGSSVNE